MHPGVFAQLARAPKHKGIHVRKSTGKLKSAVIPAYGKTKIYQLERQYS
jgi:hypothetical protein